MSKSEELSRKTRRMIAKNLIVLAVLAIVAFVGVVSWFTQNTSATADGISVRTKVEDGLEFYIMPPSDTDLYDAINTRLSNNVTYNTEHQNDQGFVARRTTWHTSSDGEFVFDYSDQEFKFMESLFLCEVTGDGYSFFVPKLMQYDAVAYVDDTQDFDNAVANDEYLSFDLYFRSKTEQNNHSVNILSDSSITPGQTYTGVIDNPSENDAKDAAIGAVRMSCHNMLANHQREVLWIPGPYVYYDGALDKLYNGLAPSEYANKGSMYYDGTGIAKRTGEGTNDHAYYAANRTRNVIRTGDNNSNLFVGSQLGSDQTVLTMSQHDTTGGYYYGRVRINLWIEGEDAEARLAFVGGRFNMSLHFEMVNGSN